MAQWVRFTRDYAYVVPGKIDGHPVIMYKAGKRLFAKDDLAEEAVTKGYAELVESPRKMATEKTVARRTSRSRAKAGGGTAE